MNTIIIIITVIIIVIVVSECCEEAIERARKALRLQLHGALPEHGEARFGQRAVEAAPGMAGNALVANKNAIDAAKKEMIIHCIILFIIITFAFGIIIIIIIIIVTVIVVVIVSMKVFGSPKTRRTHWTLLAMLQLLMTL